MNAKRCDIDPIFPFCSLRLGTFVQLFLLYITFSPLSVSQKPSRFHIKIAKQAMLPTDYIATMTSILSLLAQVRSIS